MKVSIASDSARGDIRPVYATTRQSLLFLGLVAWRGDELEMENGGGSAGVVAGAQKQMCGFRLRKNKKPYFSTVSTLLWRRVTRL
jgi:hypothetical protein